MNTSFYTAAVGAGAQQRRLDTIANNLANLGTYGYKNTKGTFSDLFYNNMNSAQGQNVSLAGSGARLDRTTTDFSQAALVETGLPLDYAIDGPGFFALYNPATTQTTYTRDGSFIASLQTDGSFYLTDKEGKWVLDAQNNPITIEDQNGDLPVAIFNFPVKDGITMVGSSEYVPVAKNGAPTLLQDEKSLVKGYLEASNVSLDDEMVRMIESQRAYQYALKMVQTSDEVETVINSLR